MRTIVLCLRISLPLITLQTGDLHYQHQIFWLKFINVINYTSVKRSFGAMVEVAAV